MFREGKIENNNYEFESSADYREADRQKLKQIGLTPEDIEQLEDPEQGGASSVVYFIERDGKKLAIKKGVDLDPNEKPNREYIILKLLARRGGKKISPSEYYYNNRKDILITERIDGELIKELNNDDLEEIASVLAALHKPEFHKFGVPFYKRQEGNQFDRLTQQVEFLESWFEKMLPIVREMGEDFYLKFEKIKVAVFKRAKECANDFQENSFSLIHYDLNPGNIMKDRDGNVLFLDWRQASIGDRAMDIAKLFYKNYLSEEQKEIFFNTYEGVIDDKTLRQRVAVYDLLVRLGSILWRLRFLNVDSRKHPQLLKNVSTDLIRSRLDDDIKYLSSLINN